MIQPLAIAAELGLPVFVIFDADGDVVRADHRAKHERDNRALIALLGETHPPFPDQNLIFANYAIWANNLGGAVKADFGDHYDALTNPTRLRYGNEGGLEKHDLFIAEWVSLGRQNGHISARLQQLCTAILGFARTV